MQTPKKKSKHFLSSEISTILNYPHKTMYYLSSIPLSTLTTPFSLKINHHKRIHSISYKKLLSLKRKSEDACALSSSFVIVADGVGGYNTYGIDPSIYSSTLCDQVSKRVNFIRNENELKNIVVNVIREMDAKPIVGGATFCSLYIDNENKKLYSCSLGDTLFALFRYDEDSQSYHIAYKAKEQYHSFNTPYQCGYGGDDPSFSSTTTLDIKPNDIIITGTDGLWDNISENVMVEIINSYSREDIVDRVAAIAKENSMNDMVDSPFAVRARENGMMYMGGKPDDITVVVTVIRGEEEDEERRSINSTNSKRSGSTKASATSLNEDYYL